MSDSRPTVALLATLNTKSKEARFIAGSLAHAGANPWIVDLSMKAHNVDGADVSGAEVAAIGGASWESLDECTRAEAASVMIEGGSVGPQQVGFGGT